MLHVGLDLSRRKLDVCLLSAAGEHLEVVAVRLQHVAARALAAGSDRQVRVRGHYDGLDATSLKRSLKQAVEVRRYKTLMRPRAAKSARRSCVGPGSMPSKCFAR
jgi:hypothetical protein